MPTTSNFGWTTPADTDLVKDGAAAIRTLGNGIDTSLVDLKGGTTGQVLSKASNTDLDFSWVAQDDSNAIQNALLTTTGDTIYASAASTPARLGLGTAGQVLTVNSGATAPEWKTPASGGKVLQVVSTTTATQASSTTNTWVTTGLSTSITPSSASSKILALVSVGGVAKSSANANQEVGLRINRASGASVWYFSESGLYTNTLLFLSVPTASTMWLDSPNTTSSTTYTVEFRSSTNVATVYVQNTNTGTGIAPNSSLILMEIGA